jgi:molybdenum cofactor cytidylyltransferase/nicotine blue oxidoreductase
MGGPKALLRDARDVPYVDRAIGALLEGGCARVTVVLGARADDVRTLLDEAGWTADEAVSVVVADDWASGMGASLRAGLAAAGDADAALVSLVDLPDVTAEVVSRVLARASSTEALVRASYPGGPGHPVLLGRAHWPGVSEVANGDKGARDYLAEHDVLEVACGDLATGRDVDHPADL